MYNINDTVVYGMTGVCKIVDISKQSFVKNEVKKYYVLKPVSSEGSTIYAPCDSCDGKLRPVLTADEVNSIIDDVKNEEPEIAPFFDREKCNQIMKSGDRKELLRLVRSLDASKKDVVKKGRKFHVSDESIMRTASKLLCDEFSLVLDVKPEEVMSIVLKRA